MESAIHVNHFARAEGEQVLGDGDDGFADVFGSAPTLNGSQAAVNQFVILFLHGFGHVCGDESGQVQCVRGLLYQKCPDRIQQGVVGV